MNKPSLTTNIGLLIAVATFFVCPPRVSAAPSFVMTRSCEGLFSSMPIFVDSRSIDAIFGRLEKSGSTKAFHPKECAAFTGACAMASVLVGVEAIEQLRGSAPTSPEILQTEARSMLELVASITKRRVSGWSVIESLGVLRFNLARRDQLSKTSVRVEFPEVNSDFVLAPNEMMILAADAGFGLHMVLMFEQHGGVVRAFDPQTGKIESYRMAQTPRGRVRMVSLTNPVGITSMLDVGVAIRISPEASTPRVPGTRQEARLATEQLLGQMRALRHIVDDFYPLLPQSKNSYFKSMAEARSFVKAALGNLDFAKEVLKTLNDVSNLDDAGLIFELNLTVVDVQRRAEEVGFFAWLEHSGLIAPATSVKRIELPKWDIKMLEARVSASFKEKRAEALKSLTDFASQPAFSLHDVSSRIPRFVDMYAELAMAAASEMQPGDAHRLMTSYYDQLNTLMQSSGMAQLRRENPNHMFFELLDADYRSVGRARAKFGI